MAFNSQNSIRRSVDSISKELNDYYNHARTLCDSSCSTIKMWIQDCVKERRIIDRDIVAKNFPSVNPSVPPTIQEVPENLDISDIVNSKDSSLSNAGTEFKQPSQHNPSSRILPGTFSDLNKSSNSVSSPLSKQVSSSQQTSSPDPRIKEFTDEYSKYTVDELSQECRNRGVKNVGSRINLINNLVQDDINHNKHPPPHSPKSKPREQFFSPVKNSTAYHTSNTPSSPRKPGLGDSGASSSSKQPTSRIDISVLTSSTSSPLKGSSVSSLHKSQDSSKQNSGMSRFGPSSTRPAIPTGSPPPIPDSVPYHGKHTTDATMGVYDNKENLNTNTALKQSRLNMSSTQPAPGIPSSPIKQSRINSPPTQPAPGIPSSPIKQSRINTPPTQPAPGIPSSPVKQSRINTPSTQPASAIPSSPVKQSRINSPSTQAVPKIPGSPVNQVGTPVIPSLTTAQPSVPSANPPANMVPPNPPTPATPSTVHKPHAIAPPIDNQEEGSKWYENDVLFKSLVLQSDIDPDCIFVPINGCDLDIVFPGTNQGDRFGRGSSGVWDDDYDRTDQHSHDF